MLNQRLKVDNKNSISSKYELCTEDKLKKIFGENFYFSERDGKKYIEDKLNKANFLRGFEELYIIKILGEYGLIGVNLYEGDLLMFRNGKIYDEFLGTQNLYYGVKIGEWIGEEGSSQFLFNIETLERASKNYGAIKKQDGILYGGRGGAWEDILEANKNTKYARLKDERLDSVNNLIKRTILVYKKLTNKTVSLVGLELLDYLNDNSKKLTKIQTATIAYLLSNPTILEQEIWSLKGSNFTVNNKEGVEQIVNILINTHYSIVSEELVDSMTDNEAVFMKIMVEGINGELNKQIITRTKNVTESILNFEYRYLTILQIENLIKRSNFKGKTQVKIATELKTFECIIDNIYETEIKIFRNKKGGPYGYEDSVTKNEIKNIITKYLLKNKEYDLDILDQLIKTIKKELGKYCQKIYESLNERFERKPKEVTRGNSGNNTREQTPRQSGDSDIGITTAIITGSAEAGLIADAIFGDD